MQLLSLVLTLSVWTSSLQANAVQVGVSFTIPPWVIAETRRGIQLDLLVQALAPAGYTIKPFFLPFARAVHMFQHGELDGLINVPPDVKNGFISQEVVRFHNVAISLSSRDYREDMTIQDLTRHSIVAFQKASHFLGKEFSDMAAANPSYREVAKQDLQASLLFYGRADFIVLEQRIFEYYRIAEQRSQLKAQKALFEQPVVYHRLFPPAPRYFVFQTEKLRDDFNAGLESLKQSGEYDKILLHYAAPPE